MARIATASQLDPLDTGSHDLPVSSELEAFLLSGWAEPGPTGARALAPPDLCAARRARLSAFVSGERVVVPAGRPARRGNGQEVRFRPASDYVYLTGDDAAGSVLVLEPATGGHEALLYVDPPSRRDTLEFYSDPARAELWVGRRPALGDVAEALGLACRPLDALERDLGDGTPTRVLRGVDDDVDSRVEAADDFRDRELRAILSELRLVKDPWEIAQIEAAVETTIEGFADVARLLATARDERELEVAFAARARREGNDVAFDPIVAAGAHATTLHWRRNDGELRPGELVLVDAGAETTSLYAADLTRTYPIAGRFGELERRALELLNDAIDAALAAVGPGRPFRDFRHAGAEVIASGLADWGLLPPEGRDASSGLYRRFTICGPGHMLGLDVHDCAHARAATYLEGALEPGHVLTVEPGLYFQADDATIPAELRGLGIRVEEDVVVTETGCRVLSARLPRRAEEVEAWIDEVRAS